MAYYIPKSFGRQYQKPSKRVKGLTNAQQLQAQEQYLNDLIEKAAQARQADDAGQVAYFEQRIGWVRVDIDQITERLEAAR